MSNADMPRLSLPANPSLALVASLASIALDAAVNQRKCDPEPIRVLAQRLSQRLATTTRAHGAVKALDPNMTGLLSAALPPGAVHDSVDSLTEEAQKMITDLSLPVDQLREDVLVKLRDFAVRLAVAAQQGTLESEISSLTWVDSD
jgi:hypothetical protein